MSALRKRAEEAVDKALRRWAENALVFTASPDEMKSALADAIESEARRFAEMALIHLVMRVDCNSPTSPEKINPAWMVEVGNELIAKAIAAAEAEE